MYTSTYYYSILDFYNIHLSQYSYKVLRKISPFEMINYFEYA